MQVFLSVGRISNAEQETFLKKLEEKLTKRDLHTKTIGRNTFTSAQPLERIREVMRQSRGLIVLAYERTVIETGIEHGPLGDDPTKLEGRLLSTPWHHVELAMAKMLELPTFVVLQKGVHQEGLLEDKHGWYVYRTKLRPTELDKDEFVGVLDDWVDRVKAPREAKAVDPGALTVGALVSQMKPAQLWGVIAAVLALVTGAFATGSWLRESRGAESNTTTANDELKTPLPSVPASTSASTPAAVASVAAPTTAAARLSADAATGKVVVVSPNTIGHGVTGVTIFKEKVLPGRHKLTFSLKVTRNETGDLSTTTGDLWTKVTLHANGANVESPMQPPECSATSCTHAATIEVMVTHDGKLNIAYDLNECRISERDTLCLVQGTLTID